MDDLMREDMTSALHRQKGFLNIGIVHLAKRKLIETLPNIALASFMKVKRGIVVDEKIMKKTVTDLGVMLFGREVFNPISVQSQTVTGKRARSAVGMPYTLQSAKLHHSLIEVSGVIDRKQLADQLFNQHPTCIRIYGFLNAEQTRHHAQHIAINSRDRQSKGERSYGRSGVRANTF